MSHKAWERAAGKAAKLAGISVFAALAATTTAKAEGQIMQGAYSPAQMAYGQPMMAQPMMQPHMQLPQFQAPAMAQQGIAPASAQTFQGQIQGQPLPQLGQRAPIIANVTHMGVTYGPPSYTPPEGFDPKMASSSPLPSHMMHPQMPGWPQQTAQQGWGNAPLPTPAGAPIYGGYSQPMQAASASIYAPAEPSYAPAEPLRPNYSAAAPAQPVYESIDAAAQAAPAQPASSYSYELAPSTTATYVGQSQEIAPSSYATAADPYSVVTQSVQGYEMGPAATSVPAYTSATTLGTQSYEAAPSYQAAPAYEPAPSYVPQATYESSTIAAPSYYGQSSAFSAGNGHFVQVGAFRNIARAERLVRKLQAAGEQPIITQATVRGKLFHRVRIPAADKRDASYIRDRVRGLGYYEARTVRG